MLNQNIKTLRKAKGLSQQELAVKLNVVRQTVSKWEQGLSVPDSDMLLALSEALDTPVNILLGEAIAQAQTDDLKTICEKLEVINLQLARRKDDRRKNLRRLFVALGAVVIAIFVVLALLGSPYLHWNYNDPETAVVGVIFHAFEWLFVRLAPILLVVAVAGFILARKKD